MTHRPVVSRAFSAAILVFQDNEMAAMLVSQSCPLGVDCFPFANAFFGSSKFPA